MRHTLAHGVLASLLLTAAAAVAGVTKANFPNITFSDGTTGTITAGSKITSKDVFTSCGYYSSANGAYLGMYESANFGTTDEVALQDFCLNHYVDRR